MQKINSTTYVFLLTSFLCVSQLAGQSNFASKENDQKTFEVVIMSYDFPMTYSTQIILNQKELKIILNGSVTGNKDSLLYSTQLKSSDTLRLIASINLDNLKASYRNECIDDGSQIDISLTKNGKTKSIQLSNYYHDEIGKIIYLTNSLIPDKYKVWYDKNSLVAAYKERNQAK